MNLFLKVSCVPIFIFHSIFAMAQDIAIVSKKDYTYKTLYSIHGENYKPIHKYNPLGENDYGYNILKEQRNKNNIWFKEFDVSTLVNKDSIIFQIDLFSKNVSRVNIYIIGRNDTLKKRMFLKYKGYQPSRFIKLSRFKSCHVESLKDETGKNNFGMSKIILEVHPTSRDFEFLVFNLSIFQIRSIEKDVYHPLFDKITGLDSYENLNSLKQNSKDSFFPIGHTNKEYSNLNSDRFYVKSKQTHISNKELAIRVFEPIFEYYPLYESCTNTKKKTLEKLDKLRDSTISYSIFLDSLNALIESFEDPHFKMFFPKGYEPDKKKELNKSPLYFFSFMKKNYIAAVFDSTLYSEIYVGDQILDCNCLKENKGGINDTMNGNCNCIYGKRSSGKEDKILTIKSEIENCASKKMYFKTLSKEGDTVNTFYMFDKKNRVIPKQFIPKDSHFKLINDISYFKINIFRDDTYLQFLNNLEDISNSKGILFDLRNCGGGNSHIAYEILSYFINKPTVVKNIIVPTVHDYKESIVIRSRSTLKLSHIPVCILINERTACAAESFTHLMQSHVKATVIGASKSFGSLSTSHKIIFPNGLSAVINGLTKIELSPYREIEKLGLTPDIWVVLTRVEDLYPYDDKVLQNALTYLRSYP